MTFESLEVPIKETATEAAIPFTNVWRGLLLRDLFATRFGGFVKYPIQYYKYNTSNYTNQQSLQRIFCYNAG